jgi:hypothetical protein
MQLGNNMSNSCLSEKGLVDFLKSYESFRSTPGRVQVALYTNRCEYVRRLCLQDHVSLRIFKDAEEVKKLVKMQKNAHGKGMTAECGWQAAMKEAGIWDDDKVRF